MPTRRDNFKWLFALAGLLLAAYLNLPGNQLGPGDDLDRLNFQIWQQLFQSGPVAADPSLVLVELPASLTDHPSLHNARALEQLLSELTRHGAAAIGIVTDLDPVLPLASDALALLPKALQGPRASAPYRALKTQLDNHALIWLKSSPKLANKPRLVAREYRWPLFFNLHDRLLQRQLNLNFASPKLALLQTSEEGVAAGFELSLLAQSLGQATLNWQIPHQLLIGSTPRQISSYGTIRPWPQNRAVASLEATAIEGKNLRPEQVKSKIVILARAGDPQLQRVLGSTNALLREQYSYSPWWQCLPLASLSLLIWIASLHALRRWSATSLFLGGLVTAAVPALLAIAVGARTGLWIETGDIMVYSLCIGTALWLNALYRDWRLTCNLEADDARLQLARLHLQQRDPTAAAEQLQRTAMSPECAELLLETGRAFERERDFAAARDSYSTIVLQCPRHREATRALDEIDHDSGRSSRLGSTLILPDKPHGLPQLGRYEIIRLLGKGAMGEVYLANDPKIRRQVAIKTLLLNEIDQNSGDVRQRFFQEAETAGSLDHPNIVSVYDVGEEGELAYITMDYVPGGTLADWTDPDRLLELATLYELMEQIATALDFAHRQKIVHRDIKPGNILFNPEDMTVKLTDFGIARLADYSRTRTGAILGSPYYMSPEQVSGKKVGAASDLYSLGVTFYQLISGGLPFEGDSLAQLAWQITNKPHRQLGRLRKGLPRSASRIINTALAKNPRERFATADEMSQAFQKGARSLSTAHQRSA